ncbi:HNH endonuclease [Anabaena sp. CCY 9402-a]|uniref:HNH endonuclease n=1 Tax=Anabaena sp. CCY 9402-a TaxID=3103867 RepID=UPI0039C635F5
MNPYYSLVADQANHRCEYCHAPELIFNLAFEVEHIIPLSRQGTDADSNLALACRSCNLRKGTRISGNDPESNIEVSLFHPRQDKWSNHFLADIESGNIQGKTSIGRVTVDALEINSQPQIMARQLWIRLGIFP